MVAATPMTLGVLFCDVVGSTRLYRELGDQRAQAAVCDRLDEIGRLIGGCGGRVVKTIGDEVMATVPDAHAAFDVAVAIQTHRSDRAVAGASADEAMRFRIGFHCGPVVSRDGDVFGTTVNVAARLASIAKADQIMTTAATVAQLDAMRRVATRLIAGAYAHGFGDEVTVAEVLWQKNPVPLTVISCLASGSSETLNIFHDGRSLDFDPGREPITLGRDPDNTIVIPFGCVSRRHATIERRGNRWLLSDHSTNGTFVRLGGAAEYRICRESVPLNAAGMLGLGESIDGHRDTAIEFVLNATA